RRVGVLSSMKLGCALGGLIFALFGCFFLLVPGLLGGGGAFMGAIQETGMDPEIFGAGAGVIGFLVVMYVVGVLFYAVVTGIVMAIYAFTYNVVAGLVGGVEVELEEL
ncbi:MAG: DUF3566 domain-containing protein, partial [Ardenticatenia bacterium]|nr:DUF3566 domain-containing protein [Ardenticatenia bacterium]